MQGVIRVANYFLVTLDTTGPATPAIVIENGASYASVQLVNCAISVSDPVTTGYQMKIWGDVDTSYDINTQDTELGSSWVTFTASKQIKVSNTLGVKTLYLKVRDDVNNESSQASDTINLDTSKPSVTVSSPDVTRISKNAGKDTVSVTFTSDKIFTDYIVKFVSSTGSTNTSGVTIPSTAGSTNVSGTNASGYPAGVPISVSIKGADLETASAGDSSKIIKIFVKDQAGNWSV